MARNYRDDLLKLIDEVEVFYPLGTKFPTSIKVHIADAKKVVKNQSKSTEDDYQNSITSLEKIKNDKLEANEADKKAALAKVEKQEKMQKQALENPDSITDEGLITLALSPPNPTNPFRPTWTYFSDTSWKLDANKLADTIAQDIYIKRVKSKATTAIYTEYIDDAGQWEEISKDKLANLVDSYFKDPTQFIPDAPTKQYAEDLHDAKAVRDTVTLLTSKILEIDPATTFDEPPKCLVHLKDCNFDVLNWKVKGFASDNYFVSGLNYELDRNYLEFLRPNDEAADTIATSLAVNIQAWLLDSLGDKFTVTAFLERLGLSFLHTYEDNFFTFIKSEGGHGKSFLFSFLAKIFQNNNVMSLDLDQMCSTDSFDASELRNKDINLTSEVTTTYVPDSVINVIKGLTGNDRRNFSQKYKGTAGFTNKATLWFNMNHLPRFETYDEAVARRADIFSWHKIDDFSNKYPLETLEKEIPELIILAMYHARKVLKRKPIHLDYFNSAIRLTRSPQMMNNYLEWSQTNDFLSNFIDEECVKGSKYKIGVNKLLAELNNYIKECGSRVSYGRAKLTDKLESMGILKSSKQMVWIDEYGNKKPGSIVFEGITLKSIAGVQDEATDYKNEAQRRFDKSPFTAKIKFNPDDENK